MIDDEPDYEDRYQQQMEREEIDPRLAARADDIDSIAYPPRMYRKVKRAAERAAARGAPRLDPELWRPPLEFHPGGPPHPQVVAYRKANRPFRRAFGGIIGGERERKILASVGHAALKAKEAER